MSAQQGASPGQAILMGQPSPTEGTGASTGVAGDKLQTDLTGSARTQMEGVSLDKQGALSGGREILKEVGRTEGEGAGGWLLLLLGGVLPSAWQPQPPRAFCDCCLDLHSPTALPAVQDQPTWKEQAKTAAREAKDLLT